MKKFNGVRHGEVILVPFKGELSDKVNIKKLKNYVLAHSETGHHHVLEADTDFEILEDDVQQLYVRLFQPANLVHKKQTDKHRTLVLPPSILKRYHDTEFDIWADVIRDVKD